MLQSIALVGEIDAAATVVLHRRQRKPRETLSIPDSIGALGREKVLRKCVGALIPPRQPTEYLACTVKVGFDSS